MAKQRRIYSPDRQRERRKEWISLPDGDLCIWSMRMREFSRVTDLSTRPPEDPRGGRDEKEFILWSIALSAYDGDGDDAKRIWPDDQAHRLWELSAADFDLIWRAVNRVNGTDPTSEERLRDFTRATAGRSRSESPSGASTTSIGSPKN
jgi:hypothetical protein